MPESRNFIERQVFEELLARVPRKDGRRYCDIATIYRDMSRLVVGWLATAKPEDLRRLYNEVGWGGAANAHAMHEAAKTWIKENRAQRDQWLNAFRSFEESGRAVRVEFSDGNVYDLKVLSTMHAEEGGDVVADVLRTVRGPQWNSDGAMNFYLDEVVNAQQAE